MNVYFQFKQKVWLPSFQLTGLRHLNSEIETLLSFENLLVLLSSVFIGLQWLKIAFGNSSQLEVVPLL